MNSLSLKYKIEFYVPILSVVLSIISVISLYALGVTRLNSTHYFTVQLVALLLGITACITFYFIDYHTLAKYWYVHAFLCWTLVLLTLLQNGKLGFAPAGTDNFSWILLPFNTSLQPAEFAKISFIITFAMHLHKVREKLNKPLVLLGLLTHIGIPILIVHIQGDDGTATVFAAIGFVMLFAAGLSRIILTFILLLGTCSIFYLWADGFFKSYQVLRVAALFDLNNPEYADILYQQLQGMQALENGGTTGIGFFNNNHVYVPLQRNDFIFTFICESLGFVGGLIVLILFLALLARILIIALHAVDTFGVLICIGVFSMILWQIVINIGMNVLLAPVIGITLPFLSAGGTSLLSLFICMGIIINIAKQKNSGISV